MAGAIFRETLRRHWRQMLYWGIGLGLLGFYVLVVIKDVDMLAQYASIVESMPPVLMQMFGVGDAAALATPEGFISFGFFSYTLLMLAVYAVMAGLNVTANEEEEGILDVLLAQPVPRWRVMAEKLLAYALATVGIVAMAFLFILAGIQAAGIPVSVGRMLEGSVNILPSTWLMIAFTAFAAVVFRRRGTAVMVASVFVIASYFINFLGEAASGSLANALRAVSFFNYYDPNAVMVSGLNAGSIALLLGVTAALAAGALWAFQRRDVGV